MRSDDAELVGYTRMFPQIVGSCVHSLYRIQGAAVNTAEDGNEGSYLSQIKEYDVIVLDLAPKIRDSGIFGASRGKGDQRRGIDLTRLGK